MSTWYEPKKEDISFDGEDMDIFVRQDYSGAVYVSLKIKDVEEALAAQKETKHSKQDPQGEP